jgi:menaquinone-dependent protoporphyrinogen IX oxidase
MKKIFKIILIAFAILIIVGVVFAGIVFMNLTAYTATGSETLTATGQEMGKALVVYDPGLTGAAKDVADKIALNLQTTGYTVNFAGIKSNAASNTADYNIIVAGGPIYAGAPTSSVKDFLNNLSNVQNVKVGVFGSGSGAQEQIDIDQIKAAIADLPNGEALANAIVVKIGSNEDVNQRALDFVAELTR